LKIQRERSSAASADQSWPCPARTAKQRLHRTINSAEKCGHNLEVFEKTKMVLEPEGERKFVTALFSDLSGYTAMTEKLDPEEVRRS